MTDVELAEVRVTADFLRAVGRVDWLSTGLTLFAIVAAFLRANVIVAIAALIVGLAAKFYAFRIAFDARLFERAASGTLDADGIDRALESLSLRKAGASARPWSDRCRGAMRLARMFAAIVFVQILATIALVVSSRP